MKTKSVYPRTRMLIRTIVFAFACIATYDFLFSDPAQSILPIPRGWLLVWGPVWGPGLLLIGWVTFLRGSTWGARVLSRRAVRIGALLMLLIGGCPWLWLSALTQMSGGRPGNEGDGMLGTIIFLFVGLPGLLLMLGTLAMKPDKKNKKNKPPHGIAQPPHSTIGTLVP
jgi:hypothetical protein